MTLKDLATFDTPTIANAMESLGIAPRSFTGPELGTMVDHAGPLVGIAVTGTMREQWGGPFSHLEPWLQFLKDIERSDLPVIAVLQDTSSNAHRDAMVGEGMARAMQAAGAVGCLCDGAVRDIQALRAAAFPVWARGCSPDRGLIRFHELHVAVRVAGMQVLPGDVIHADSNGAVVVPQDRVEDIARTAAGIEKREQTMFRMFSDPDFRVARLYEHYAELLKQACS